MADTVPAAPVLDGMPAEPVKADVAPKPGRSRKRTTTAGTRSTSTRARKPRERKPRSTPVVPRVKVKTVGQKATDNLALYGAMLRPFQPADSDILLRGASPFGQSLDQLCAEYPSVEKVANMLLGNSAVMSFAMITGAMVLPLLANHQLVPDKFGAMGSQALAFFSGDITAAQLVAAAGAEAAGPIDPELQAMIDGTDQAAPVGERVAA